MVTHIFCSRIWPHSIDYRKTCVIISRAEGLRQHIVQLTNCLHIPNRWNFIRFFFSLKAKFYFYLCLCMVKTIKVSLSGWIQNCTEPSSPKMYLIHDWSRPCWLKLFRAKQKHEAMSYTLYAFSQLQNRDRIHHTSAPTAEDWIVYAERHSV